MDLNFLIKIVFCPVIDYHGQRRVFKLEFVIIIDLSLTVFEVDFKFSGLMLLIAVLFFNQLENIRSNKKFSRMKLYFVFLFCTTHNDLYRISALKHFRKLKVQMSKNLDAEFQLVVYIRRIMGNSPLPPIFLYKSDLSFCKKL